MTYDAIVIGSGQGGNPLSHKLADLGWRVALIEKEHLGGTCINTGCTPTKTMVASAQVAHYARHAARWGVRTGEVSVDLARIMARKDAIVQSFRSGQERKVDQRPNLDLHRGHARFIGPHAIQVGAETLEGERIFVNTGTRPEIPRIEGLDGTAYLTNATIMELRELPEHLLVLGGGYIGLEFGQMFRRFGSRVTIVHRGDEILTREDPDVAAELQKLLEGEGVSFVLRARTNRVQHANGQIALMLDVDGDSQTVSGSHLLVATGRRPNTDDLGLEQAGVQTDAKGYIPVNGRLETNVPGIWALGDVKGGPAFTHISYNDYQILYANLVEGKNVTIDHRIVPYSVFTDPQLGRVGITEKDARAKGHSLKIGKIPMSWVARAIERDETGGFMKLIVDAGDDRILGAAILATEGGELIQMLGTLMLAGLPYTLLKGAIYIHPTLAEGFFTLMEEVKPA
ncbi:dihydrolipoyl dehydrogenase [Candidatus Methylomirabilis lanthanidiphila]|uniref:Dihydrolipoyl dehydrogenase n=1 Tax=Candidatus Methylomirabilis lanthanidiphila TaxID=2211376 RepID=A0A564ZIK7_9BACT|nr:mercuric reductase [Candidatus Methylomirabilis lanthanidiphila]VUZ84472.1 dihydrolipoyl dehydrogenase [Candidatus Methylomirabilis lanthanidiphila]